MQLKEGERETEDIVHQVPHVKTLKMIKTARVGWHSREREDDSRDREAVIATLKIA